MSILKSFFFVAIIFVSTACGSGGGEAKDPLLKDAFSLYEKAERMEQGVVKGIENLIQQRNSVQVQGKTLTVKEITFSANAKNIENKFNEWKSNRVEVLGFGEHHNCSHDDHHHAAAANLTPQQMLDIQKESLDNLVNINKELELLLGTVGIEHKMIENVLLNR